MKSRNLPDDYACLQFAAAIADDFTPKNTEDDMGVKEYKFSKANLLDLIYYCQGKPVQNRLWKDDYAII